MKEYFFKVRGNIWHEDTNFKDEFILFVKALDERHAVMVAKDYLRRNAPSVDGKLIGRIIIDGVEERKV